MDKKYKAVAITVTHSSSDEFGQSEYETRYVIKDMESGTIVDDAQGYGYRTVQKAYAGWSYQNRDKSKDKEKAEKENVIANWMKENKSFINLLDALAYEIWKGKWGPEDRVDTLFVSKLLEENGYKELPFTAGELLKYWKRGPVYSRRKRRSETLHKRQN